MPHLTGLWADFFRLGGGSRAAPASEASQDQCHCQHDETHDVSSNRKQGFAIGTPPYLAKGAALSTSTMLCYIERQRLCPSGYQ